jgi:PKD repeat protein
MEATGHRRRRIPLPLFILGAILLLLVCIVLIVILYPFIFPPPPPPAALTADADGPYTVNEAQPLTLDGSGSKGDIATYAWDLGDGTPGAGPKPVHTYPDGPKQYTVTLTVTDTKGQTATDTAQVTVNNLPPTANAGGPYTCEVGETIQLDGTCDDPSSVDAATLTCTWADFSGAALSQPSYNCPTTPETRTVTLTATDKDGASAQSTALITVVPAGARLIADADGPYSGVAGSPVTVDGSGSSPADRITSYEWDFGDGQTGTGAVITHTYAASGTYTLTLTVSDGVTQDTDTATATITAEGGNQPPQAVVTQRVIPKTSNRCYSFTGSASQDPDGQIVSYVWDLGDQTTRIGPEIEYCYTRAGTYRVTLTVTDDGGATSTATTTVKIP